MKKNVILLCFFIINCSNPNSIFVESQNYRIGKVYSSSSYYESIVKTEANREGGMTLLIRENKCLYRLFLNKNNIVTGWDYTSDPCHCKITTNWRGPW